MAEARRLSDPEWLAICAATKLTPDAEARAEIERCLFVEYPAFRYDAKRVAASYRRGLSRLKLCEALAELYRETPAPGDDIKQERDLYFIERLRRRAFSLVAYCQAIRRANRGRRDSQRAWLISRLCGIYLDNFDAERLTVTVPGSGGPPRGPLIDFLLAAMRLIIQKRNDLPLPEALRDAIDRERRGREHVRQLVLDLRQRDNGVLKREK